MSSEQQKTAQETLDAFNSDVENFIKENSERILCIMAYSVSFEMQPYVASYQRYFNHDIISKYDTKSIYAYNLELPNFLNVYIIMQRQGDTSSVEHTRQECKDLIVRFNRENEHVLGGLSAIFYEIGNTEKVDELHFGDKTTLNEIKFFS